MRIAFHTLGCKVNQYETEALCAEFRSRGHRIVGEEDEADVYVINTCTVTGLADRKSRQFLRRRKREHPEALVVATGCYVQISPEEVENTESVDLMVGMKDKDRIPQLVEEAMASRQEERTEGRAEAEEKGPERSRAYLKIQDGCDRCCSYCVIPAARGPVHSRPMEEILAEAKHLVTSGFCELILTGINTALYEDLIGLLARLEDLPGDFRIRLSSLEPTVVDHEYVKNLLPFSRLCHHLHLSMQSGSDRILAAMNRPYTREEYFRIVHVLRDFDPGYGITTDMIVGFPGEEETDFLQTVDAVERCLFGKVHVFRYSPRPGTAAKEMAGQIPATVKKERGRRLAEKSDRVAERFLRENMGQVRPVLWERIQEWKGTEKRAWSGYTDNYIRVHEILEDGSTANEDKRGSIQKVQLKSPWKGSILGEPVL